MNPSIINNIMKFLKRVELDKFREIKNYCLKQITEHNSYNMFRVEDFDDFRNSEKWCLYKNLNFEWMKNEGENDVSNLIWSYEEKTKPIFESKNEFDLFSFCDLALFINEIGFYGEKINDTCFEWITNFKNLKIIRFEETNVTSECVKKILKNKELKIDFIRTKKFNFNRIYLN